MTWPSGSPAPTPPRSWPSWRRPVEHWRPDVLVTDETFFAAPLAAERLSLPYATFVVTATGSMLRPDVLAGPLDEVRAELGLPADPTLAAAGRYLVLAPCPPSFRDPRFPLPATGHCIRPGALDQPAVEPFDWPGRRPDRPTVYVTLGTEFNLESGDLFWRLVAGLRRVEVNTLVTTGHDLDPAELGPQPPHVEIRRYVPQCRGPSPL